MEWGGEFLGWCGGVWNGFLLARRKMFLSVLSKGIGWSLGEECTFSPSVTLVACRQLPDPLLWPLGSLDTVAGCQGECW